MSQCVFGLSVLLTFVASAFAQQMSPQIEWQKCYGGTRTDGFSISSQKTLIRTSDGGFAFVGSTNSNDGDVSGYHDSSGTHIGTDIWVVKLNESGVIEWQKCLGGSEGEDDVCLIQTSDQGYAVVGYLDGPPYSNDGDLSRNGNQGNNIWLLKLGLSGVIEWQRSFGGGIGVGGGALGYSVIESNDSGYVVAGSETTSGEGFPNHGLNDAYIVKFNSVGDRLWQKCLGGSDNDEAKSIVQTADGGYVFAGTTQSDNGDVSGNHIDTSFSFNSADVWMVKLNSQGLIERQKCVGGTREDALYSMIETSDGGFALAAESSSTDGDLVGINRGSFWIVKLDSLFHIQWQRRIIGTRSKTYLTSIIQTLDSGYALGGWTYLPDSGTPGFHANGAHGDSTSDIWAAKLSPSGRIEWQKCFGGYSNERGRSLVQTPDSGYVIIGATASNDGDVSGNHGGSDIWVVKLKGATDGVENGNGANSLPKQIFKIYPNPSSEEVHLQLFGAQMAKSVKFYDVMGREFIPYYDLAGNIATVHIQSLPQGVYMVRYTFSYNSYTGTYTLPLVVQH